MTRKFLLQILPRRFASITEDLQYTISKLQRTSSSTGFVQQALHHKFTPIFAKVNGNFGYTKDKWKASKSILEHNLREHNTKLQLIVSKLNRLMYELNLVFGVSLTKCIYKSILSTLRKENLLQIKTKLKKIRYHVPSTKALTSYVPVISLSSFEINSELLNFGLKHCFVNKSKHTKRNVAVELESLASKIDCTIDSSEKENVNEYLRSWTNKFTENIHCTKDNTFKSFKKTETK